MERDEFKRYSREFKLEAVRLAAQGQYFSVAKWCAS